MTEFRTRNSDGDTRTAPPARVPDQPDEATAWGQVGQGPRDTAFPPLTPELANDHRVWLARKAEIVAAARGELPTAD